MTEAISDSVPADLSLSGEEALSQEVKLCHLMMMACEEAIMGNLSFKEESSHLFDGLPPEKPEKREAVQRLIEDPKDPIARESLMFGTPPLTSAQEEQIKGKYLTLKSSLFHQPQIGSWMGDYRKRKRKKRGNLSRQIAAKEGMVSQREINLSHDLIDLAIVADASNLAAIHRLKEEVEAIDALLNEKMPRIREALALDNQGEISLDHVQEEWKSLLALSRNTKKGKAHSETLQKVIDRGHLSNLTQKEREAIKGRLETEEMGHKHALQVATQKLSMGQHQYLLVIDILRKTLESQTRAGERIAQKQY